MIVPLREIARFVRAATTDELLDRVTVYRDGMEPAALDLMEGELDRRGVTRRQIAEHDAKVRAVAVLRPDGTARRCERCDRPAVVRSRGWHRVFGVVPVFRRTFYLCDAHTPLRAGRGDPARDDASPGEPGA